MTEPPNKHDLSIAILRGIAAVREYGCSPAVRLIGAAANLGTQDVREGLTKPVREGLIEQRRPGVYNLTPSGRTALELIEHVAGCNRD